MSDTYFDIERRIMFASLEMLSRPHLGWWGSQLTMLKLTADPAIPTFSVNGVLLKYNPDFAKSLQDEELIFVLAHEVSHCSLGHLWRGNGLDWPEWGKATDYVINQMLTDAKVGRMPEGGLLDESYRGMSADEIYGRLMKGKQKQQEESERQAKSKQDDGNQSGQSQGQGDQGQAQSQADPGGQGQDKGQSQSQDQSGQGQGQSQGQGGQAQGQGQGQGQGQAATTPPCPTGDFTPGASDQDTAQDGGMTCNDWTIAAEQATMACDKAGTLPGAIATMIRDAHQGGADWREVLRRFVARTEATDYSITRPNRRWVSQDVYLPGMVKANTARLAIGLDTSGSCHGLWRMFAQEITAILHESRPEAVDVYYCDVRVTDVETFTPDDAEVTITPKGGGGTKFQPVFDYIEQRVQNGEIEPPACVIYLTDLENSDTVTEPDYPVLWVTSEATRKDGRFGETVRIPIPRK